LVRVIGITDYKCYTSHSLRRSGATFLANQNISLPLLKIAGRWVSEKVATNYIQNSDAMKRNIANLFKDSINIKQNTTNEVKSFLETIEEEKNNLKRKKEEIKVGDKEIQEIKVGEKEFQEIKVGEKEIKVGEKEIQEIKVGDKEIKEEPNSKKKKQFKIEIKKKEEGFEFVINID